MKSKLTKDRGTRLEQTAVQTFGKSKGVEIKRVAPKLYYKTMEQDGVKWKVCGKIDAQVGDQIIEVKNRKNRFMCPIYDYIQLQTYLFLCDKTRGVLLERLNGANKETSFPFDEEFWRDEVTPELRKFVVELSKYIETGKDMLYGKSKALSPAGKRDFDGERGDCEEKSGSPPKMLAVEKNGVPVQLKTEVIPTPMIDSDGLPVQSNTKGKQTASVIESDGLPSMPLPQAAVKQVRPDRIPEEPVIKSEMHSCIATHMSSTSARSEMKIDKGCKTHSCVATSMPNSSKMPEFEKEFELCSCIATDLSSPIDEEIEEPMSPVY